MNPNKRCVAGLGNIPSRAAMPAALFGVQDSSVYGPGTIYRSFLDGSFVEVFTVSRIENIDWIAASSEDLSSWSHGG